MKLGEGNAFTCVCQSFCSQGLGIPGPISFPRGGYLWYQVPSGVVGLFWGGYLPSPRTWEQRQGWVGPMRWVCQGRDGYPPDMGPEGVGMSGCGYPPPSQIFTLRIGGDAKTLLSHPWVLAPEPPSEMLLTFEICNWTSNSTSDPKQLQLITPLCKWVIMADTNLRNNHAVLVF